MNRYLTDEHVGNPVKRQRFEYNNETYYKNTNLLTDQEFYTKLVGRHRTIQVLPTIDLELAFETRNSRHLW